MKKTILLAVLLALAIHSRAIDFYGGSYPDALSKARTEKKLLLIYFTASWCGPCQYMQQYVFPDPAITAYVAQKYIALKIDVDEKEGKLLYVKTHPRGMMGVPAFIILNDKEEIIKQELGAQKIAQLQTFLRADQDPASIFTMLSDSLAQQKIAQQVRKPTLFSSFLYNSMVSDWKPAFKIGANLMNYTGNHDFHKNLTGFEVGIFFDRSFKNNTGKKAEFWHLSRYRFQPGITLASKSGQSAMFGAKATMGYLSLDLLNSYQLKGLRNFRLFASPYVATRLWSSGNFAPIVQTGLTQFTYGTKIGISRGSGSFEPYLGYDLGLGDLAKGPSILKNRGFYFSIALIFGK
ncbi:MAG: thioredoxin family protein [Pedobacter sp.]|nr:thioredoxin family protein [Pedobacter sp.]MDQ8052542.1 thioredoxin family protein [Pedobacter sp.]